MNVAFFLEELSAREMLNGLLPRILPPQVTVRYVVFQGKHDLDNNLVRKLRGWQTPNTMFVVLQDQDGANCVALKQRLRRQCDDAGKPDAVVRIVCRELESWYFGYFGDLQAVEQGLELHNMRRHARHSKYRVPDSIHSPASELKKITHGAYQKVGGSRAIGHRMSLEGNTSHSFGVFVEAVRRLVGPPPA